jgi:hypothetical protein
MSILYATIGLGRFAKMFPTPTCSDVFIGNLKSSQHKAGSLHSVTLPQAVMMKDMFPTPVAYDSTLGGPNNHYKGLGHMAKHNPEEFLTPSASDGMRSKFKIESLHKRYKKHPQGNLSEEIGFKEYEKMHPSDKAEDNDIGLEFDDGEDVEQSKSDKLFPTPRGGESGVGMCGGSGSKQMIDDLVEEGDITAEEGKAMVAGNGGSLSSDWTENLMYYPTGWTNVDIETPCKDFAKHPGFNCNWEEGIPRLSTEKKNRVNRLKAIGNAIVPKIAEILFLRIKMFLGGE